MLYIWKQICKLKKLNQEIRYTQTQTEATNKLGAKRINKLPHTKWSDDIWSVCIWKKWERELALIELCVRIDWKRINENVVYWILSIRNQFDVLFIQFWFFFLYVTMCKALLEVTSVSSLLLFSFILLFRTMSTTATTSEPRFHASFDECVRFFSQNEL